MHNILADVGLHVWRTPGTCILWMTYMTLLGGCDSGQMISERSS